MKHRLNHDWPGGSANGEERKMASQAVEELLEDLYTHEFEEGPYPADPGILAAADEAVSLGVVSLRGDRCRLTARGQVAARDVIRRHRLAERLLCNVLATEPQYLEKDACRFEHVLKDRVADKVCSLLGHPESCPHGKPIPEGKCCRESRQDRIAEVGQLCDGRPGAEGTVAYLSTRDHRAVQKMMAMGILPGTTIKLIRRFPSYVFQVGYSQFALDRPLAEMIYVHWSKN
jgi:DtxR family Mn-dependent transcriptional regulator